MATFKPSRHSAYGATLTRPEGEPPSASDVNRELDAGPSKVGPILFGVVGGLALLGLGAVVVTKLRG